MEHSTEQYAAFPLEDIQQMVEQASRINAGNGLRRYLIREGFKQEDVNLFSHREPAQLIELSTGEQGVSYINRMDDNDKGRYIQFLQNRLFKDKCIIPNQKIHTFCRAVEIALHDEKTGQRRPLKIKHQARKRKGKGI